MIPLMNPTAWGNYVVTLSVTNTSTSPVDFGEPTNSFWLSAPDGPTITHLSLFDQAKLVVLWGEWTGPLAPGETYDQSLVFFVPKGDPNIAPDQPTGWVLHFWDGGDTKGKEFLLNVDPTVTTG